MKIFEYLDIMVQEGKIDAGDSSLAFLKENYFKVDDASETLYYAVDFNDINKYGFTSFINRRHYDLFSAGRFFETGMTYYENNEKKIKPYILAFYSKEDESDSDEVRKIEFVDRINKIKTTNEVQLVFSISLIEDKLYIDDVGIMYNHQIVTFDKINVICQFYDMRHETVVSDQVFYDEGKVTFSKITMKRIATKNGLITKHINSRIVMNLKTGRTYKLNDFDLIAKRKVDVKRRPFLSLTAWNLNWMSYGVAITDEDFMKIGKAIEETVNDKDVIPFEEYAKGLDTDKMDRLQLLAGYNTNPFVPYSVLVNMYLTKEDSSRELNNYNRIFSKNFNCKVLRNKNVKKELMAFLTTQGYSKKFINLKLDRHRASNIIEDKRVYDAILELENIEDKNNKWKIVEGYFQNDDTIYEIRSFYDSEIYRELKKTHKEKDIVNAATKLRDMRSLNDLAQSFQRLIREIPEYQIPTKRLRLMEIHDIVCGDARKLNDNAYEYEYSQNLQDRFNRTVDGYDFSLATDSLQLVEVGTEMGICVGSYGKRVADKQCIIVTMRKDDKYVGCIEINSDGSTNQVKAIRNNSLEGMELQAFRMYTKLAKLNTRMCCDLPLDSRIICDFEKVDIQNESAMKVRVPKIINGQIDFEMKEYVRETHDIEDWAF